MKIIKNYIKEYIIISLLLLAHKNITSSCKKCQSNNIDITRNCISSCQTNKEQIIDLINKSDIKSDNCFNCNTILIPKCDGVHTVFIPRSQGSDTARYLMGPQNYIYDSNKIVHTGTILGYTRSYKSELINYYLFNKSNNLNFIGSEVPDRRDCDMIADYFGLSPLFQGRLNLDPHIENIIFDNLFFLNLSKYICGLYLRLNFPIVNTRYSMNINQEIIDKGSDVPQCYMKDTSFTPPNNILEAINNNVDFGKFYNGKKSLIRLADIDVILGYNLYENFYNHLGIYLQAVAPTGNKPNPTFIFDPIVGNSKHWEFGVGLSAHKNLWYSEDSYLSLYLRGNFTHLFKSKQLRSFDLINNGTLSRYLPLREYEADGITPTGKVISVINLTTFPVDTKFNTKGDFTLKLEYLDKGGLNIDLGYNIYGRSAESFARRNSVKNFNCNNKYGIKGTTGTCFLAYSTNGTSPNETFGNFIDTVALNSTQSDATIYKSGTIDNPTSPELPQGADVGITWNSVRTGNVDSSSGVVYAEQSNEPQLITLNSIDYNSGLACGSLTHSVFAYIGYDYPEYKSNLNVYYGIGGKIEFNDQIANERKVVENDILFGSKIINRYLSSLNQWGIFFKGGIIY